MEEEEEEGLREFATMPGISSSSSSSDGSLVVVKKRAIVRWSTVLSLSRERDAVVLRGRGRDSGR